MQLNKFLLIILREPCLAFFTNNSWSITCTIYNITLLRPIGLYKLYIANTSRKKKSINSQRKVYICLPHIDTCRRYMQYSAVSLLYYMHACYKEIYIFRMDQSVTMHIHTRVCTLCPSIPRCSTDRPTARSLCKQRWNIE